MTSIVEIPTAPLIQAVTQYETAAMHAAQLAEDGQS